MAGFLQIAVGLLLTAGISDQSAIAQGSQHYCNPIVQGWGNWSAESSPTPYSAGATNCPHACKDAAGSHLTANDASGVVSPGGFNWNVHVYIHYSWQPSTSGVPPGAWNVNDGGGNINYTFVSLGTPSCDTTRKFGWQPSAHNCSIVVARYFWHLDFTSRQQPPDNYAITDYFSVVISWAGAPPLAAPNATQWQAAYNQIEANIEGSYSYPCNPAQGSFNGWRWVYHPSAICNCSGNYVSSEACY